MFLTANQLLRQFEKNLCFAQYVDIAVAWATSGPALKMLCAAQKKGVEIRAIVGTVGNATEPDALERLAEIGELRLVDGSGKLFHPKIYIFRGRGDSCAWVGSANFTRAGFGNNEEGVQETNDVRDVLGWFEHRWRECDPLRPRAIEDYQKRRALILPSPHLQKMTGALKLQDSDRLEYLRQAHSWYGYVTALRRCHEWWEVHENDHSVLDKRRSWVHTIEEGRPIARKKSWSQLSRENAKILLGTYDDSRLDSALLGTMRGNGVAMNVFLESTPENEEIRERIRVAVSRVIDARASEFPDVAVDAVKRIKKARKEGRIGIGVATRILALARPDRIVSMNKGAKIQLKHIFPELSKRNLYVPENYGLLLERLYREPWFDVDEPGDELEGRWWSMRAALLDCFAYSP